MYMIIVHGHNTIHWARSYCGLANILRDANKWSEILGGRTFPYSLRDLHYEFYDKSRGGASKITMDANDGYMISIMYESDPI